MAILSGLNPQEETFQRGYQELMLIYDQTLKELVPLSLEVSNYCTGLDKRNEELDHFEEWPPPESLQRELAEIDQKIAFFIRTAGPFQKVRKEFKDGIVSLRSQDKTPQNLPSLSESAFQRLSHEMQKSALEKASEQISRLFNEIQQCIARIQAHPRERFCQRIGWAKLGYTHATYYTMAWDKAARYLPANPFSTPVPSESKK